MLTNEQIEKIPYKNPICCEVWNTHSTPELMRVLKETSPLVYKALLHANKMDETLSPIDFNKTAEQFASALQIGRKNSADIDFNIFSIEELSEIKTAASEELAAKQEFLSMLAMEGVNDSSYEMYANATHEIKNHVQMLSELIKQKSKQQEPACMEQN